MLSRTLFYALVAINIVLAALLVLPFMGVVPVWSGASEPERLAKQLAPDSIRVVPVSSSSEPEQTNIATLSATSEPGGQVEPAKPSGATSPPVSLIEVDESRCVAYKGLSDEQVQRVAKSTQKLPGLQVKTSVATTNSFWVHIPPDGGKEAAERRVEVLQRNGFADFFIVRESGPNQFAVSLGLYRAEELAKRRLESLQKSGIKTAVLTQRENVSQRIEISGQGSLLDKLLADLARLSKDRPLQRDVCAGG